MNDFLSKPLNKADLSPKLCSALSHLLKNALKFTTEGSVEFGCAPEPPASADAGGPRPQALRFFVKDTGIGIPPDRREAIFERFVQADISDMSAFQGAGLGLSISKAYVEMMGGSIRVESEVGKGSAFHFTLPCEEVPDTPDPSARTVSGMAARPGEPNLKILIAEDDEAASLFLRVALREISGDIHCVDNGAAAVKMCRDNPSLGLVLMDMKMPIMDGYEATRRIREFDRDVVIIAQTAFALAGDREKSIAAGCDDYLSKPLSKSDLLGCVAANLPKCRRAPAGSGTSAR